ncbi:SpaH/EbpB family LPXTG-anchored major pilin [Streptococcus sp. S784/96/1]|uniref:SpaH/EbpB family LPXTG-anchored major pilin n=1 Tax=Streptococcus sp. S784/96/1 TaxID=2653499 RepID=UPI00138A596A|nr:SpaH/EbpB family LPXTG-anchored major pilin [Streptococcus sp. S784/96/1]
MKKKIIKSILAATLILGTVAPATTPVFAADTGTITIKDTQNGQTYTAYKLFDATVDGDAVSYTLPDGELLNTLKANDLEQYFDVTKTGDLNYFTPKKDDAAAKEAIIKWAQGLKGKLPNGTPVTENDNDGTATLNVGYGYYIVTSTLEQGSVVMVTSNAPFATIHEKNSKPGWGQDGGKITDKKTYNVGDEISYTVTYKNAMNYNEGKKVYQYIMTDDMPDGAVTLVENSIEVKVGGVTVLPQAQDSEKGYTFAKDPDNENDFTITVPWSKTQLPTAAAQLGGDDDFFYSGTQEIVITYKGILKSAAAEGSNAANTNTARITPNEAPKPSDPGKSVNVYDGEINIKKVDGIDMNKTLAGAKFVLRRKEDSKYYKFDEQNQTTLWIDNLNEATVKETDNQGVVKFTGLAEGSYDLIETVAPKGYNLLKEPTSVTLTFKEGATGSADTLIVESTVKNNRGAELPSTGSFGTKLLYIVGTTLVIAAGVTLVARRRAED